MFVAVFIGFLALVAAVLIVVTAVRRHQRDTGMITTWSEVKEAFSGVTIRDVRKEAALLSEPQALETDIRVGELFDEAEEGSGYIEPRDILTPRTERH